MKSFYKQKEKNNPLEKWGKGKLFGNPQKISTNLPVFKVKKMKSSEDWNAEKKCSK